MPKEGGIVGIKYDLKTNKWIAFYSKRDPITKVPKVLRKTGIKTKAHAKRAEQELIVKIHSFLMKKKVPTWKESVESFKKHGIESEISIKTVEDRDITLKAHTFSVWADRLINSFTPQEIRNLINERLGHRFPSTQKNLLKCIRGVFEHAFEEGHVLRNPTPKMKFNIGNKLTSVLNEQEAKYLLKMAKEYESEWYPHWAFALMTGMRNGELYALTWEKIDLIKRQIRVDTSWNNKDGFKTTKSGDHRIIEIAKDLDPIIAKLKENTDSVFILPRIDKWDKGDQARELRSFLLGVGLPRIRFHDLRATWATILLNKGVPVIKVMKMGGWRDIKTMQHYTRLAGVDIKGITDFFDFS